MAEIQLRGFPPWTENDDIKVTIENTGCKVRGLWWTTDPQIGDLANVKVDQLEIARTLVRYLHGFAFTPGYPLQARLSPGQAALQGKAGGKDGGKDGDSDAGKDGGKAGGKCGSKSGMPGAVKVGPDQYGYEEMKRRRLMEEQGRAPPPAVPTGPGTIGNCIGAGRVEGWLLSDKGNVSATGFGYVKSFAFGGNCAFRTKHNPLISNLESPAWTTGDSVTFEVVIINNQCEAVNMALLGQEHQVPEPGTTVHDTERELEELIGLTDEMRQERTKEDHRKKRRAAENEDPRYLFFQFPRGTTEKQVRDFASQAGTVIKVNIFIDMATGETKGCGKVLFEEEEAALYAFEVLNGQELNNARVKIEKLGQQSRKKGKSDVEPVTEDRLMVLPTSFFSRDDTSDIKVAKCMAALQDMMDGHDEKATGHSMIFMIRTFVKEVNDLFATDPKTLNKLFQALKTVQWFWDNNQQVRWQASKNKINVSKFTGFVYTPDGGKMPIAKGGKDGKGKIMDME